VIQSHFTGIDWLVVIVYFIGVMGIGLFFWRRSRSSTEEFTAGGRSLSGWLCGLSIFATYLSSISFLAYPGKSFAGNWNAFVFSLSLPIATWIAVVWFLPYYRSSGEVSAYAMLEKRFGSWARIFASAFYLVFQIARMGVVMYLTALPMSVIFGWDIRVVIVVTGICVTLYSFIGGIIAVIWADAIQAVVLLAGAIIALLFIWSLLPAGVASVAHVVSEHQQIAGENKFSLGSFQLFDLSKATFWVILTYGLFENLKNFGIDQSYIQRYIAASSDTQARISLWFGGLIYIPVSALFFLIGTSLFAFYESSPTDLIEVKQIVAGQKLLQEGIRPELTPQSDGALQFSTAYQTLVDSRAAKLEPKEIGDRVFPHFIAKHLPVGLTGLLIAAIFAAAMSTLSTSLNSSATLIMSDFYQRFLNRAATEKSKMWMLYAATIAWGVLGTSMALVLVRTTESALDLWWNMSSILGGGILGLFLLGMLSRQAGNRIAILAVLIGCMMICWLVFFQTYIDKNLVIVIGSLTILLSGIGLALLLKKSR
jgi:SSS family solute:Na+ symporter